MNAFLRKTLFSEPTGPVPGFRCVALVFLVGLFGGSIVLAVTERRPSVDRYLMTLLSLSLLLEHLAVQFRWRRNIFVALRSLGLLSALCLVPYFFICMWWWFHQ